MPLLTKELIQCLQYFGPMDLTTIREKLNLRTGNNYSEADIRVLLNTLKEVREVKESVDIKTKGKYYVAVN